MPAEGAVEGGREHGARSSVEEGRAARRRRSRRGGTTRPHGSPAEEEKVRDHAPRGSLRIHRCAGGGRATFALGIEFRRTMEQDDADLEAPCRGPSRGELPPRQGKAICVATSPRPSCDGGASGRPMPVWPSRGEGLAGRELERWMRMRPRRREEQRKCLVRNRCQFF
jgi:hypothetical protein